VSPNSTAIKPWLVGGAGTVKVVLLFKWEKLNSGMVNGMKRVRGHVEWAEFYILVY
jgi:hypothetical protein